MGLFSKKERDVDYFASAYTAEHYQPEAEYGQGEQTTATENINAVMPTRPTPKLEGFTVVDGNLIAYFSVGETFIEFPFSLSVDDVPDVVSLGITLIESELNEMAPSVSLVVEQGFSLIAKELRAAAREAAISADELAGIPRF